jgi:hypothetical protein
MYQIFLVGNAIDATITYLKESIFCSRNVKLQFQVNEI